MLQFNEAGATTLNIPDTVGYNMPSEYSELNSGIKSNTPGIENVIILTHCQNDLGLSTVNTIAVCHVEQPDFAAVEVEEKKVSDQASEENELMLDGGFGCLQQTHLATLQFIHQNAGIMMLTVTGEMVLRNSFESTRLTKVLTLVSYNVALGDSQFLEDESTKKISRKVEDHYSARTNQTLEEREANPIIHLKKLNNWIKSVLIQLYASRGDVVLDHACGKGGDLIKWDKAKIGYYVGIDIAEGSVVMTLDCRGDHVLEGLYNKQDVKEAITFTRNSNMCKDPIVRYGSKKAFVDITDGNVAFRDNVWLHNSCAYDVQNDEKSMAYRKM
ncbi:unnamed protein product [Prunus armeniaca]|uniref:mRNA (guanine-N(7))-methyltransferase n=1 Tax=Prunus armeniaca TaxID=36596 RepID=A0A6J5WFW6_PRUAR|nr:unnamed protein product [Prunus armeniaca]